MQTLQPGTRVSFTRYGENSSGVVLRCDSGICWIRTREGRCIWTHAESATPREGVQGASAAIGYVLAVIASLCAFIFNIL